MLREKLKSDDGLMGPTHALSALSIALLITWLFSDFMLNTVIGSKDLVVFITAMIIIIGAALMPDLDAVNSTSINTLGIVGVILSKGMRAFSSLVQGIIKGPYDKNEDPHRGFWHTIFAAFLVGAGVTSLVSIPVEIFNIGNKPVTIATFSVMFIVYISIQLTLASLMSKFYKKNRNNLMERIIVDISAVIVSVLLVRSLPVDLSYSWVGAVVTFGWITHLLGDVITVSGAPILFPIKFKGKRWWNFRLPFGIKAGGFIEDNILLPLFGLIAIISLYNIIPIFR